MGKVKEANKIIKPAIDYLKKKDVKKLFLDVQSYQLQYLLLNQFKTIKSSKIFLDPNLILANAAMKKYHS
jgi:aspartate racemase